MKIAHSQRHSRSALQYLELHGKSLYKYLNLSAYKHKAFRSYFKKNA